MLQHTRIINEKVKKVLMTLRKKALNSVQEDIIHYFGSPDTEMLRFIIFRRNQFS